MTTTNEMAVSLPHSDLALESLLPAEPERLLRGLAGRMRDSAPVLAVPNIPGYSPQRAINSAMLHWLVSTPSAIAGVHRTAPCSLQKL
jgi:hypothetical protein